MLFFKTKFKNLLLSGEEITMSFKIHNKFNTLSKDDDIAASH